jgi:hypothetical protein
LSGSVVDENSRWYSSRDLLADEIMAVLQDNGLIPVVRGDRAENLDKWLDKASSGFRDAICKRWCEGQASRISKAELAALIADALANLNHLFPAATLSVYIVRFSADKLCKSWTLKSPVPIETPSESDNLLGDAPDVGAEGS